MRTLVASLVAGVAVLPCGACAAGEPPDPPVATRSATVPATIDPGRVGQSRSEVPPGFEFADLAGRVAPVAQWGMGATWAAEPASCAVLADPPLDPATLRGWSASGPGAIVYVVAAVAVTGLDVGARANCGHFSVTAGHTTGDVSVIDSPAVDGAETVGVRATTTTTVEGGTETHSHAETLAAHLGGHVAYVTVVTDPGLGESVLGDDFAARLLTTTTSAMRGG